MSGTAFVEEEFLAHVSFQETAGAGDPVVYPDPTTSPPAPLGSLEPNPLGIALGGRSYRGVVTRAQPTLIEGGVPAANAPGTYYLTTDYDVAMADLDPDLNVWSAGTVLRSPDLIRIGSTIDAVTKRVRGVYRIRLCNTGGANAPGLVSDEAGSLVTITLKRVNPNQKNPAI